jgi:3-dehydroquinate synthase
MKPAFEVRLKANSYPVYLGNGLLRSLGHLCRHHEVPEYVVVLSDTFSGRAALKGALAALRRSGFRTLSLGMPAGERQKSPERVGQLHTAMLRAGVPRQAALIALGGGVVGDVGGFTASTYRRGLTFVQCPTTLLSQVDSSVGGKNGVNHPLGKNVIGSYLQPKFVLSDVALLQTLPRREVITGLGEILKYPFVGDPSLLDFIEKNLGQIMKRDQSTLRRMAERCLCIKTQLVSRDEKEQRARGRNLLNVGHTVGHAIETLSHYRIHHGEAVFLGIIAEGWISVRRGWMTDEPVHRLASIYRRLRCRFNLDGISTASILKSVSSGRQKFILPGDGGRLSVVNDVTPDELREGLRFLGGL